MSRVYSISAIIDIEFVEKNIFELLAKGIILNLKYYEPNFEIDDPFKLNELKIDQACRMVLMILKNDVNGLEVSDGETFFSMYLLRNNADTKISFRGFHYFPWMRTFKYDQGSDEDIDIPRYLRLMLDLIEEYKILELKVEKD